MALRSDQQPDLADRRSARARSLRASRRLAAAVLCLGLAGTLPACSKEGPDKSLAAFLNGWHQGKLTGLRLLDDTGQALSGDAAQTQLTALEGALAVRRPELKLAGKPKVNGDNASATVNVSWPVAEQVVFSYPTTVSLRRKDGKWTPLFGPATVHPELHANEKLALKRTNADRGGITDANGTPIVTNRPVVIVGIQPSLVKDLASLTKALDDAFKSVAVPVDLTGLPEQVRNAKPDAFIEVVTLRREVYDQIRAKIHDLDGTQFVEAQMPLAPSRVFARALLGGAGEVTKEIMDKNPGKYQVGDIVGLGGLQQRYDDRLRGTPGITVIIPRSPANADKELFKSEPKAGESIKITVDAKAQNAADAALAGETRRSSLVAIRVSDGAVLAVANGPAGGDLNLALTAQVPPGSTFKMITTLSVLDSGAVTPDTVIACPKTIVVDGRPFKNAHDLELGNVPFHIDFAKSCNTAFASLAPKLGTDGLAKTAATVGVGVPWDLGIDVYSGKVSSGGSLAEQAAAAFGQGTTQVSPIALAAAAAAVARGQWKQPKLVLEPAPAKPAPDGPQLKPEALAALRNMMREVVTAGTATPLAKLPGDPVYGKTGTAEFDNNPEHTHSWFIGFRGDIAFAAFVENGGLSTATAVPLAGRFLTALG
jgi:cell division protein FtsI/penicillin-binding protein 2